MVKDEVLFAASPAHQTLVIQRKHRSPHLFYIYIYSALCISHDLWVLHLHRICGGVNGFIQLLILTGPFRRGSNKYCSTNFDNAISLRAIRPPPTFAAINRFSISLSSKRPCGRTWWYSYILLASSVEHLVKANKYEKERVCKVLVILTPIFKISLDSRIVRRFCGTNSFSSPLNTSLVKPQA